VDRAAEKSGIPIIGNSSVRDQKSQEGKDSLTKRGPKPPCDQKFSGRVQALAGALREKALTPHIEDQGGKGTVQRTKRKVSEPRSVESRTT